jgi:hypothetical protein
MGYRCFSTQQIGRTFRDVDLAKHDAFNLLSQPCTSADIMYVLIGALIIIVGAFAVAAINEYVDSLLVAIVLQVFLFAIAIGIFVWLR